jgi:arylsulfatase A-like enzyme
MNNSRTIILTAFLCCLSATARAADKPNILFILADDLGYGDVQTLNPDRGKIPTPNLDRLASQGIAFTDAHSGSSVCSPTRYGVLTGRYAWRTSLRSGVLGGVSPPLIAPDRLTVAKMLKSQGYQTAAIGKWHLGLEWAKWSDADEKAKHPGWQFDFSKPIAHGPITLGFDSFFGITASLDMPPFTFIENDHVTALPTAQKTWVRKGPAALDFEAIDVLPTLTAKAIETLNARAADARVGKPFFMYLALTSPHTPILPSKSWQGKSNLSPYGDFVMQTDACVGEVLAALDKNGLANNTLVIFTSDNGCSPAADIAGLEKMGHFPSQNFRGAKADIWEGGHRVPFFARWPGKITAGVRRDTMICLTDFLATAADLTGAKLPDNAAEDSFTFLPDLLGTGHTARTSVVNHSINGQFAIREPAWKLEFCPGSGGWGKPGDLEAKKNGLPALQLYDMTSDAAEKNNVESAHPETVQRLTTLLETIVNNGRSTPGAKQNNDLPVDFRIQRPKPKD